MQPIVDGAAMDDGGDDGENAFVMTDSAARHQTLKPDYDGGYAHWDAYGPIANEDDASDTGTGGEKDAYWRDYGDRENPLDVDVKTGLPDVLRIAVVRTEGCERVARKCWDLY